jgi:hypothetical protein
VLSLFGASLGPARRAYGAFVAKGVKQGRCPDLVSGGLLRLVGGWFKLKDLRDSGIRIKGDERILGSSDFVERVLKQANENLEQKYRLQATGLDLEQLLNKVAQYYQIDPEDLKTASKESTITKARTYHHYFIATMQHMGNYDYDTWASQGLFFDSRRPVDDATPSDLCANFIPPIMDSKIPIYNIGGWFDGFARGTTELYSTMKDTNPSRMLMQPAYHGNVSVGFAELLGIDLVEYYQGLYLEALRWFDRWLKGVENGIDLEDPILIYVMNGKGWRQEKQWPLSRQKMRKYYFEKRNRLSIMRPWKRLGHGSDDYVVDFTHNSGWEPFDVSFLNLASMLLGKAPPVSNTFYANRYVALGGPAPEDLPIRTELDTQCLTYTSAPMIWDTEVTGHPKVHLWVSSTAAYGDLYFYLEDVDKHGEAVLISEYPLRAGFAALHDNDDIITTADDVDVLADLP